VEYLSDICDQAGKRILPEATEWHNPRTISQATKLFPKQACPGKKQWTMFRKFLRSTYGRNSWNFTLETPLGEWTTAHDEREWIHYHDHTYPAYFQRKQDKWLMWTIPSTHDPFTKIRIESSTPPFTIMESLPEDCIPISDITNKDGHIDYLIPTKNLRPVAVDIDELLEPQDIPANATFPDFIQSLQDAERILLEQNYEVNHDDGPSLLEMLQCPDQTAELIIVTDGGAVTNQGSFGWVIGTLDRVLWKCKGPAHGLPIHSFRAESVGVLSVLWFLDRFCEFYNIKPINRPTLWLGTDSLSFLDRIKDLKEIPVNDWYANVFAYSDIDVTLEIFKCLESHPFAYVFNHVKGHQDDKKKYSQLSRPSQLNVLADELATEALRDQQWDTTPLFYPMPHCKVYLKHNGVY
jgi:hypothetical protein